MRNRKVRFGIEAVLWASLVYFLGLEGIRGWADYRGGAGGVTVLESTVSGTTHTPVVSTVPGSSGTVMNSIFTSGTSALAFDTGASISTAFDIIEIRFHVSTARAGESLTVTVDSGAGTEFDTLLFSDAMSATSTVFRPTRPIPIRSTDTIGVAYPNTNSDTIGLEFLYVTP